LINYVDTGIADALNALNLSVKVVPNEDFLKATADKLRLENLEELVEDALFEKCKIKKRVAEIVDSIKFQEAEFTADVTEYLDNEQNSLKTWRTGLEVLINSMIDSKQDDIDSLIAES